MKRIFTFLLAAVMLLGLISCSGKTDWEYIEDKGEIIVGITLYEPMNYKDDSGKLIGFETEFAEALAAELGVKVKFQQIEWSKKEAELEARTIDLIWNGLTVSEERAKEMAFSTHYMINQQVAVVRKSDLGKYTSLESFKDAKFCAESGSAGETLIKSTDTLKAAPYNALAAQKDCLLEVKAGTSDVAVLDSTLALACVKDGTDYSDLAVVSTEIISSASEDFAIGIRLEDTEFKQKIDDAIAKLAENGKLKEIADKYGLTSKIKLDLN